MKTPSRREAGTFVETSRRHSSPIEPPSVRRPCAGRVTPTAHLVLAPLLLLPVVLTLSRPSEAQTTPLRFHHLGVEDGLSNAWVRTVLRDSRGFLWIGTVDGLNRYDGTCFVQYRHEPADPTGLASSEIWTLFEDSRERLWVGSEEGLYLYDRDGDRLERHRLGSEVELSSTARVVRAIAEDQRGGCGWQRWRAFVSTTPTRRR